jgi:monothiol glutaredoxin
LAADRLELLLRGAFPDADELRVEDRTGGGDHFQVIVTSPRFDDLPLLDQHRLVNEALAEPRHDSRTANQDERDDMSEISDNIKNVIENEPVALFMKGTPEFVMCGNSDRALRALREAGAPVTAVNVLPDPAIRQALSELSGWPTIPQVFVGGELVGGADIVQELAETGQLPEILAGKLGESYRDAAAERVVDVLTPAQR